MKRCVSWIWILLFQVPSEIYYYWCLIIFVMSPNIYASAHHASFIDNWACPRVYPPLRPQIIKNVGRKLRRNFYPRHNSDTRHQEAGSRGRSPPRLSRAHCPLSRVPACPRRHIHTRPPHAAQPAWIFYTWPDLGWETGRRLEIERVLENKALNNWLGQFLGHWSGALTNKVHGVFFMFCKITQNQRSP